MLIKNLKRVMKRNCHQLRTETKKYKRSDRDTARQIK